MKKRVPRLMISICLVLLLSFPAYAAAPTDANSLAVGLGSGWYDSDSGYPVGYGTSWYYRIYRKVASIYNAQGLLKAVVDAINTNVNSISSNIATMKTVQGNIRTDVATIQSDTTAIYNYAKGYLPSISTNTASTASQLGSSLMDGWKWEGTGIDQNPVYPDGYRFSWYRQMLYSLSRIRRNGMIDWMNLTGNHINTNGVVSEGYKYLYDYIYDLAFVLADEDDIAMKQAMKEQQQTVTSDYLTGSGGSSGSIKASSAELGDFKGVGQFVRGISPSGVSISDIIDLFNPDSDTYSLFVWFKPENAHALNPGANPATRSIKSAGVSSEPEIVTHYLTDNLEAVESFKERDK